MLCGILEAGLVSDCLLKDLSFPVAAVIMSIVWNVTRQLMLPQDTKDPPVVFHLLPFVGSTIAYSRNPTKFLEIARKKYGDIFTVILIGRKMTFLLGPRGNKFIFGARESTFSAIPAYNDFLVPIFGKGVCYDIPHEVFQEQKKFLSLSLTPNNFPAYIPSISNETHRLLASKLSHNEPHSWAAVDVRVLAFELFIFAATSSLAGARVREHTDGTTVGYYHDLACAFGPLNYIFPNSLLFESNRRRNEAHAALRKHFTNLIRGEASNSSEHDMLSVLLDQRYRNGESLDENVVAHLMILLLVAGLHTSVAATTWLIIRIAMAPEVARDLYSEQVAHFKIDGRTEFRPMTWEIVRKLPLMNAVIRETLRMHPPVPVATRYVSVDTPVPFAILDSLANSPNEIQYIIPQGHYILAAPLISQKDSKIWKNADTWDPYRWIDEKGDLVNFSAPYVSDDGNAYQPFGGGPHRCIGEKYANMQLAVTLGILIRESEFRINALPKHNDFTTITLPIDGTKVNFRKRCPLPLGRGS